MSLEAAVSQPPIEVSLDYSRCVNLAFQQNAIPLLRRVEIRHEGALDLHDITCTFRPSPGWARDLVQHIDRIPAASDYSLSDLPLELDLDYLVQLSDRVRGQLELTVRGRVGDAPEAELLWAQTLPVDVFAHDEWTGLSSLPEILAAFVTPNIFAVERLLSRTADLLGRKTASSALNGYQPKSKKRVYEILDCIFDAVREEQIRYSNPPASFEDCGQRVRFGEQILRSKLGTCLDLSLLFAAAIEQSGLRPLVLLHQGHAYVGCWLVEDSFPEPSGHDLQSVRKRVELEELVVFESTLCCEGSHGDFTQATIAARAHLALDAIFNDAIDICRARASGIRPLPLKRGEPGVDGVRAAATAGKPGVLASNRAALRLFAPAIEVEALPQTPAGRIDHWKQQLLDLTLRNRLLNFRETKQTIPLACPHPEELEDELAASRSFKILEATKLMAGLDPRSLALQERQFAEDPVTRHLEEELRARRLRSPLGEMELSRRLLELYRRSRFEMEESGANTLYLALGFLEWKETKDSDRSYRAPILLIPLKLERQSVHQGFSIQRYDEDAMINVTLLELLKRDCAMEIPGVNPPPEDELGVDVAKVFWLFQQAVKEMPGWEVHREAWIAQFSFSKFLLWKDLHDRVDSLSANAVVDHLVNRPGEPFLDSIEQIAEEQLDDALRCDEVFCPVSADSSQLTAVMAAAAGKNFVMHGPPGTGKSQTITNLIAHCLAVGKRVLFVAEKRAALEVVHKRLSQIGLGPFCLQLHSNKTGKAEVLQQFGEALDFAHGTTSEDWAYVASQLEKSRDELNAYVRALHQVHPNGFTAYHCYAWLIAHREREASYEPVPPLAIDDIEEHSREHYDELLRLCDELTIRGSERRLSPAARDALRPFAATSWTPDWEDAVLAAADALEAAAAAFGERFEAVRGTLGLGEGESSQRFHADAVALASQLVGAPALPADFVQGGDWRAFAAEAATWLDAGARRDAARAKLEGFDLSGLRSLAIAPLEQRFQAIEEKGGLFAPLKKRFLLKPVRQVRQKGAGKWTAAEAPAFFALAREFQESQAMLDAAQATATARFGSHWQAGEGDWVALREILAFGDALDEAIARLAGEDLELLVGLRSAIGRLLPMAGDLLAPGRPLAEKLEALDLTWQSLEEREAAFRQQAAVDSVVPLRERSHLGQLRELVGRLRQFRDDLQSWCRWQHSRQTAFAAQLGPLLEALEQDLLPLEELRFVFEMRYRQLFLRRLISRSEVLRHFWGDEQEQRIQAFNELDARYTALTAQTVVARLAGELPRARREDCPRNTELGVLQRERAKKARHKPVRKLFSEIPNIIPKLKPCFLMSPLSVAQYLDVEQDNFDLVVFDEASQIPVWDAVGAIARGKQVVIVGDPRQLPPTNFFGRSESDEEAIDDGSIQDLESILDECLGSGLDVYHLRWHYRSRREGLIAFSNHHYYENRLYTFPSPHAANVGVRLVPVPEGFYDKGKSRTNPGEAEAITQEVLRRLKDPVLSQQSIGIVTFSQAQQTLILDKLDQARREHPEIEGFFGEEVEEPLFVKNLENVQGDERDVIIFSICYGPDRAGKVSMNFGPLNRTGGERRLNVAVTRAKHEILVFSTLRSEQIDLSRTRALGAEHLKAYLEYGERGPRALATGVSAASLDAFDSLFEQEVAALLRRQGHEVHTQVGCSGYRIDLALVAPEHPGHYVLGIECDGASYHRAATARDRDRLRQAVLGGLGWRMHRIWSTDWWRNREQAEKDLLEAVEEALRTFSAAEPTAAPPPPAAAPAPAADAAPAVEEERKPYAAAVTEPEPRFEREAPYPQVHPQARASADGLYAPGAARTIRAQARRIIEAEGPIVESLIIRRLAEEWQVGRIGPRIREILLTALPDPLARQRPGEERVFWPEELDPDTFTIYRVPHEQAQSQRSIEEVPRIELENAALDVLERYISYPREDLQREVARKFGISRLTRNIAGHLDRALDELIARGEARTEGAVLTRVG